MAYDEHDARIKGERRLWNDYALALMYPRNLPDNYPDEAITADLKFLATNHRLPWEVNDEFFEANWPPSNGDTDDTDPDDF
jgi:hypothetical protein